MNSTERDTLVIGIARRLFEEEAEGRSVAPGRLVWAAGVLDQRPTTLPTAPRASCAPAMPLAVSSGAIERK